MLLAWLDPDRDAAGAIYETIREALIQIFTRRGCRAAEDLADRTVDRVIKKLPERLEKGYEGDKKLYFYSVARYIAHEYFSEEAGRVELPLEYLVDPFNPNDEERRLLKSCLDTCLQRLSEEDQNLFLAYQDYDKETKIEDRKRLALRMGLEMRQLRTRMFKIRLVLEECIRGCVRQKGQMK